MSEEAEDGGLSRPDLAGWLRRWAEVCASLAFASLGAYWAFASFGFLAAIGWLVAPVGLGWAFVAWRSVRLRDAANSRRFRVVRSNRYRDAPVDDRSDANFRETNGDTDADTDTEAAAGPEAGTDWEMESNAHPAVAEFGWRGQGGMAGRGDNAWAQDPADRGVGVGVVFVDEGRISYCGPQSGGSADIADLEAIFVESPRRADLPVSWILEEAGGTGFRVPADAEGAEALHDEFASLPGMAVARMMSALRAAGAHGPGHVLPVWRRGRDR